MPLANVHCSDGSYRRMTQKRLSREWGMSLLTNNLVDLSETEMEDRDRIAVLLSLIVPQHASVRSEFQGKISAKDAKMWCLLDGIYSSLVKVIPAECIRECLEGLADAAVNPDEYLEVFYVDSEETYQELLEENRQNRRREFRDFLGEILLLRPELFPLLGETLRLPSSQNPRPGCGVTASSQEQTH